MIPYLDHPLGAAGQEHGRHVLVPGDVVDRRVVRRVRLQVLRAVLRGALVDEALVGAHEKHAAVVGVEGDASTALWGRKDETDHSKRCSMGMRMTDMYFDANCLSVSL